MVRFAALRPALNEQAKRLRAEAQAIGRDGIARVSQATGVRTARRTRDRGKSKAAARTCNTPLERAPATYLQKNLTPCTWLPGLSIIS